MSEFKWYTPQEDMPNIGDKVLIKEYSDFCNNLYHVVEVVEDCNNKGNLIFLSVDDWYSEWHPLEVEKWTYIEDEITVYWNDDFGGVMTSDDVYGVQLVKTSESRYPLIFIFVEGWTYDGSCVCKDADGECEIEDIPSNVLSAMRNFMENYER